MEYKFTFLELHSHCWDNDAIHWGDPGFLQTLFAERRHLIFHLQNSRFTLFFFKGLINNGKENKWRVIWKGNNKITIFQSEFWRFQAQKVRRQVRDGTVETRTLNGFIRADNIIVHYHLYQVIWSDFYKLVRSFAALEPYKLFSNCEERAVNIKSILHFSNLLLLTRHY